MTRIEDIKLSVFTERLPNLVDVGDGVRRSRWLARFVSPVAATACPTMAETLADWCRAEIQRLYGNSHSSVAIERACPRLQIIQVDDLRHIVEILLAGPEREIEHSFLISNYGVLKKLHELHPLDELQGLPPHFWYFLKPDFHVGPRESF